MMDNYKKLAVRYLKMNKRRCVITIISVVIATTILYGALNLGWSKLLDYRDELRAERDYEIVFMTKDKSQIDAIMADSKVKSASIAPYYDYGYNEQVEYENALYINTTNPYRIGAIQEELEAKYDVESEVNFALAATYMQGDGSDLATITILFVLLLSYLFAIFSVGVVRNSIQLFTLEQIKDYGNMRCIGATKGQLKAIIYMEGAILELIGNIIGFMTGFVASYLIGLRMKLEVGFYIPPMILVLIVFFGDLYFAMGENCKLVTKMSPVSAIRGEFRIRKEKLKARKKSIYGKLFGVEGDYAYKNIMRNPGRFYKTVWSMGIAVAAFTTVSGAISTFSNVIGDMEEQYAYYQVYFGDTKSVTDSEEDIKRQMPSVDILEAVGNMESVTDVKRMYAADIVVAKPRELYEQYTDEYLDKTAMGQVWKRYAEMNPGDEETIESESRMYQFECFGYDEVDLKRYQDALVEGTLDVSESGIILINNGSVMENTDDSLISSNIDVTFTNYKVGDTIDILDMERLQEVMKEELAVVRKAYEEELAELNGVEAAGYDLSMEKRMLSGNYQTEQSDVYKKYYKHLIAEGAYKTYTIEGIVKDEVNHVLYDKPRFIAPLEQYYKITGTDETLVTGMQYHVENFNYSEYEKVLGEYMWDFWSDDSPAFSVSDYPYIISEIESYQKTIIGVGLGILVVVGMSIFNIINTTASSLHMRKKELAQLRVIGVSKKRLMKMVMLEGVIASIAANVIGIIMGAIVSYVVCWLMVGILFGIDYSFPIVGAIIGVLVSTLILCGSIYDPLKDLKQDIAADLALGGE